MTSDKFNGYNKRPGAKGTVVCALDAVAFALMPFFAVFASLFRGLRDSKAMVGYANNTNPPSKQRTGEPPVSPY